MYSFYHQFLKAKKEFFQMEAAGGILLVIAAAIAILIANSGFAPLYNYALNDLYLGVDIGVLHLKKSVLHWINDGLMVIFFFLVSLEIKREFIEVVVSSFKKALLPIFAAIGGMAVPATIFWLINIDTPQNLSGWAIPSATDIAFALGVLALLGSRAPISLKILLTAIAVIDDLGAIVIIALFYTHDLNMLSLMLAGGALLVLFLLNRAEVGSLVPYIIVSFILWLAVLHSGIHATVAGVAAAMFIRFHNRKNPDKSPLLFLERSLHPWVAYLILPLFAFANAGVSFEGLHLNSLFDPVTLGIACGLFFGKQIGVFLVMAAAIVFKLSPRPEDASWGQLYGVSLLCGIGFTMSLFIGTLAYDDALLQAEVRLGVITGSVFSAISGYIVLYLCGKKHG